MERIPLEVIIRHACREIGNYFAEQAEQERRNGKVAVLVEDFTNSIYYMPCDTNGFPNYHQFNYMTFDSLSLFTICKDGQTPTTEKMHVKEISIIIERPILAQRYDYEMKPIVFMWSGRKIGSRDLPLEKLNISELMKLAQKATQDREGLVIDEAIKNKIYK